MGFSAGDLFDLGLVSNTNTQLKRNLQAVRSRAASTFSSQLSQMSASRSGAPAASVNMDEIQLRLAGENCVYTGGWKWV